MWEENHHTDCRRCARSRLTINRLDKVLPAYCQVPHLFTKILSMPFMPISSALVLPFVTRGKPRLMLGDCPHSNTAEPILSHFPQLQFKQIQWATLKPTRAGRVCMHCLNNPPLQETKQLTKNVIHLNIELSSDIVPN